MATAITEPMLPPNWGETQWHGEYERLARSPARHRVVAAGRQSGKTRHAKLTVLHGDEHHNGATRTPNGRFAVCAPTYAQVRGVWWDDLKILAAPFASKIEERDLLIRFPNGATIQLFSLDAPERVEGRALHGVVVDETQEIVPNAWFRTLRPMLSGPGRQDGWSLRIGRPSGRNHFYEWFTEAKLLPDHDSFHWGSAAVQSPESVAAARASMDPRSFAQEYEASFLTLTGLVCYQFDRNKHCRAVRYDPKQPLIFSFDFNVAPGSAVVMQEQSLPTWDAPAMENDRILHAHTCVIDEIFIPTDSRTPEVCARLAAKFPDHQGMVLVYGDPAGNQNRTSAETNDWQQVMQHLRRHFKDVRNRVPTAHPPVIDSVNSTNTRMLSADGTVRFAINPEKAPQTLKDIEGVQWDDEKPTREIDKGDLDRTHWLDAVRYYIHEKHPLGGAQMAIL